MINLSKTGVSNPKKREEMREKLKSIPSKVKSKSSTITEEEEIEMILDVSEGKSHREIANQYGVVSSYVSYALKRKFGSLEQAKAVLLGLTLENALACQIQAGLHISELTGQQAVVSGAILTDKAIALEKSIRETPQQIDFSQLKKVESVMNELKDKLSLPE